jgi:prevent-host-death family protein
MTTVTIEEAKQHLAELIDRAASGEEIFILRDQKPLAKLMPVPGKGVEKPKTQRSFGSAKDMLIYIADDFDEPLEDFKEYME